MSGPKGHFSSVESAVVTTNVRLQERSCEAPYLSGLLVPDQIRPVYVKSRVWFFLTNLSSKCGCDLKIQTPLFLFIIFPCDLRVLKKFLSIWSVTGMELKWELSLVAVLALSCPE